MNPNGNNFSQQFNTPQRSKSNPVYSQGLCQFNSPLNPKQNDLFNQLIGIQKQAPIDNLPRQREYSNLDDQLQSESQIQSAYNKSEKEQCQNNFYQTVKRDIEQAYKKIEINEVSTQKKHKQGCNCDKSKCLKSYCVCYRRGETCSEDCKCEGCQNDQFTSQHHKNKKLTLQNQSKTQSKGCFCKNSNCLKKYCICHQNGRKCSDICKCFNCHNIQEQKDQYDDKHQKGVRLLFTTKKRVKISEFDLRYNGEKDENC